MSTYSTRNSNMVHLAAKVVHTVDLKHVASAREALSLTFTESFETLNPLQPQTGSNIYNALPMNRRNQAGH